MGEKNGDFSKRNNWVELLLFFEQTCKALV